MRTLGAVVGALNNGGAKTLLAIVNAFTAEVVIGDTVAPV